MNHDPGGHEPAAAPLRMMGNRYGRQSHGSERSIARQLENGRDRFDTEGWELHREYSDEVSASRYGRGRRDDWEDNLDDIRNERIQVLWLWESSRGDRRNSTWSFMLEECQDHGVRIYVEEHRRLYDPNNLRDWKILAEDGVDNEYESRKTRGRVISDVIRNAENGGMHGPIPYGFTRRYEMRNGRMTPVEQYEHPVHGPILKRIFSDLDAGKPLSALARELNEEGAPTRKGGTWLPTIIRLMVLNYAYVGLRSHDPAWRQAPRTTRRSAQAKLYKAQWAGLVDEGQFYRVRQRLLANENKGHRPGAAAHLLSRIAVCTQCEQPLRPRTYEGQKDGNNRPPVYVCNAGHVAIYEDDLDRYVVSRVLGELARPAVIARLRALSPVDAQDELAATRTELEKAEAQLADMERELLPDFAASFKRAATPVQARIEAAKSRIRTLGTIPELGELISAAEQGIAELAATWDAMLMPARREAIRKLAAISVRPGGRRVPTDASRVSVRWLL